MRTYNSSLQPGDLVTLLEQDLVGEVVKVMGQKALISFAYMLFHVPVSQIKRVQPTMETKISAKSFMRVINLSKADFISFHPELDLHGMYLQEALNTLDKWIDKGFLLGHKQLRIIHGIGKGILRQQIGSYLQSHKLVKRIIKNPISPGFTGITVVELS